MTKAEIRRLFLEKRSSFSDAELAEKSGRIANGFFEIVDLSGIKYIHGFLRIPKFNEVDTSLIYKRIWSEFPQIRICVPRIDRLTGAIESVAFDAKSELFENEWGIREPLQGDVVDAEQMDIVLVPLVAFDEAGHRVGYGKGFYDRLLAKCRPDCLKIGLSYFSPVKKIDDIYEHDVRLDMCITPEEVFDFRITSAL